MRCEEIEVRLLELIEEELSASQRAEVLTHLHDCTTCAAALAAYQDILTRVQVDPVPEPPPGFWEEFGPSLKRRIGQEAGTRKPTADAWLIGIRSWLSLRPRFIAGLAVAAVSLFIVVRLPGIVPVRTDRQAAPVVTTKVMGQDDSAHDMATAPRLDHRNPQAGEPLVVAGDILEEPSIVVAAVQRLRGVDEITDRLEIAWMLRPDADPLDALASLNEEERQILFNRMRGFQWSQS